MTDRIRVCFPGLIDVWTASYINGLDSNALDVVQAVDQALKIAAVAKLVGHDILLEYGAIDVIITGVAVDVAI